MLLNLLEAITPITHSDPGAENTGNATPFRMQRVLYRRRNPVTAIEDGVAIEPDQIMRPPTTEQLEEEVREVAARCPMEAGSDVAAMIAQLTAEEFLATTFLLRLMQGLNALNGGEGEGLFKRMDRYNYLTSRLHQAASSASSLRHLYDALLRGLCIESDLPSAGDIVPTFFGLSHELQSGVVAVLSEHAKSIIGIARAWQDVERKQRKDAWERGQEWSLFDFQGGSVVYDPAGRVLGTSQRYAEALVPIVSANALRHVIFRQTLADHLLEVCGVPDGSLPPAVAMLFYNGGNVEGGTKEPGASGQINEAVAGMFPSIALLKGCLPTHILGRGALSVASWTLCRQMNDAVRGFGYESDVEAGNLLVTITQTRHTPPGMGHGKDDGQMLFSFTAMKPGARILMGVQFEPFTPDLVRGAAYYALARWQERGAVIGGRSAEGYGLVRMVEQREIGACDDAEQRTMIANQYERYVEENADLLREALVSGNLGWSKSVIVGEPKEEGRGKGKGKAVVDTEPALL